MEDPRELRLNAGRTWPGRSGSWASAVRACRSALQLDPSDAETWHRLGVALLLLRRDDEGEQAFRRVLALDGGHTRARFNLGTLLRRTSPGEAAYHAAVLRRQAPDLARLLEGDPGGISDLPSLPPG